MGKTQVATMQQKKVQIASVAISHVIVRCSHTHNTHIGFTQHTYLTLLMDANGCEQE